MDMLPSRAAQVGRASPVGGRDDAIAYRTPESAYVLRCIKVGAMSAPNLQSCLIAERLFILLYS